MKTQGITLMTSQTTEVKIKKKTNAQDATFDNFIANNASGVSRRPQNASANIAETKSSMEAKSSKVQSSKQSEDGSSSDKTQSKDAVTNGIAHVVIYAPYAPERVHVIFAARPARIAVERDHTAAAVL